MRTSLAALLAAFSVLPAAVRGAEAANALQQVVSGVEVYLGVVPAEIVAGHPATHPERQMHGGATGGYHVMVALFDHASGQRITDAQVSARLGPPSQPGPETRLEPMTIAGAPSYGNFLDMTRGGSYRIDFQIRRPGRPEAIPAVFQWTAR